MDSLGLYLLIDKPTRVTEISTTLVDNIIIIHKNLRYYMTCGILSNDISHHLLFFAICEYHISRNAKIKKMLNILA